MHDEHHDDIGGVITRLREQQGWSQRSLASWVGLDQSAVSRIESGQRRVSAEELRRFAHAFHVSADELLLGLPEAGPVREASFDPMEPPDEDHAYSLAPWDESRTPGRADAVPRPPSSPAAGPGAPREHPDIAAGGMPAPAHDGEPDVTAAPTLRPRPSAPLRFQTTSPAALPPAAYTGPPPHRLPEGALAAPSIGLSGLPAEVADVVRDWSALRALTHTAAPAPPWSTGHSAEGRLSHTERPAPAMGRGSIGGDVLHDRVARFWRSELHVDPDDGPLPDLVPLLEDALGVQVIVARVGSAAGGLSREAGAAGGPSRAAGAAAGAEAETAGGPRSAEHPVAAAFVADGVPFAYVNAARPVVLQRYALAHAFAHLMLGHGDVVDRRIEWSRNNPREAAANDFAEELLAPVRAVRRWYERHPAAERRPSVETLLEVGNAFGVSAWAALYRSRAAGRLPGKQFHMLRGEMRRQEWQLLPRQAFLGGLRDTLTHLTPGEVLPPGAYGPPAVLRVPAAMRAWALEAVRRGLLSLEEAAAALRLDAGALEEQFARLGLE